MPDKMRISPNNFYVFGINIYWQLMKISKEKSKTHGNERYKEPKKLQLEEMHCPILTARSR